MSLESWKAEFYPVAVAYVPLSEALAHSLRKWEGLRPENLQKHDCYISHAAVCDRADPGAVFMIDASSCTFCFYYNRMPGHCGGCPVAEANGRPCDKPDPATGEDSPYGKFCDGDPWPMITLLKKTRNRCPTKF